ncbi:MAG: uroporphyrinogen decarboxylase family protein [Armatimonadota bacterium]
MNGRELLSAIYTGEQVDRFPLPSVSPWGETMERWNREGLPPGADVNRELGLVSDDYVGLNLNLNMVPVFPIRILDEGAEYVTLVDEFGVTKRMIRRDYDRSGGYQMGGGASSSMSHWIDFPVKDLRSWKTLFEERFHPSISDRVPTDWDSYKAEFNKAAETRWSTYGCYPFFGLFGPMRELMGFEGLIYAMMDNPALIHTMVDDLTSFWLEVFSQVVGDVRIDQVTFFEDMCATKAPLISPAMFREFLSDGYREVIGGLREMGVQQFWIDTDGNAWDIIPEMLLCGVTGFWPCEVNAGMDVECLRARFPGISLGGGIDKHVIAGDFAQIDAEIERCYKVAWRDRRYIPALDHGAPPDISWRNIQRFAERCRDWCSNPR